jgi:hypothetical protein
MIDLSEVDVASLRSSRKYPEFDESDDDFHDESLTHHWWETETNWFSWNVPERQMGGWTYCQARPNANLCNGGAWVWDDTASFSWELPYHVNYSGLRLPERSQRDMRDFEWPNGVHVTTLEPLMRYLVQYEDSDQLRVDLVFDAFMPPNPHPVGISPFFKGTHFDQAGHVTGEIVLRGERIPIDCLSFRDRSWGPRPMGRPKPRPPTDPASSMQFGGVGYSFGAADSENAWLVYSVPGIATDAVVCGFLLKAGKYGHIIAGERELECDPWTGWPNTMCVSAIDEFGRELHVQGIAASRHWRGHGGDSLFHWNWDGFEGWGEDQSYFSRSVWEAKRSASDKR